MLEHKVDNLRVNINSIKFNLDVIIVAIATCSRYDEVKKVRRKTNAKMSLLERRMMILVMEEIREVIQGVTKLESSANSD